MRFLILVVSIALCASAWGQAYPAKPVKVVVPFPPGSTPDLVGRTVSERLQKALGQPFVVENRTGAVAKSAPDGYTLLVSINGPVAVAKHLYKNLPYDPDRDLAPISLLASAPQMLVVKPDLPIADFKSFVQHAKQNPGRLSYGSVGGGSASHLTMELLKSETGVFVVHIPYRGFPPAVTDMLAGNIDTMFAIIPAVLPHVKAGKMRALAVTAQKRNEMAPEVPSVAELGLPQLESLAWIGLLAPAGVSKELIDRISAETVRGMRSPEVRELLGKQGFDVVANSPQEFSRWIQAESAKWARVIRLSGATPD
jgi:tripartite-type tricarboxylate transporter receptor subunit TctC